MFKDSHAVMKEIVGRIDALEAKPSPPDLGPVVARLAALERRPEPPQLPTRPAGRLTLNPVHFENPSFSTSGSRSKRGHRRATSSRGFWFKVAMTAWQAAKRVARLG